MSAFPGAEFEVARAVRLTVDARMKVMGALSSLIEDDPAEEESRTTPEVLLLFRKAANEKMISPEYLAHAVGISEGQARFLIMDDEIDEPGLRSVLWAAGEVEWRDIVSGGDIIEFRAYRCANPRCGGAFTADDWLRRHGERDACDRFSCRCAVYHEICA